MSPSNLRHALSKTTESVTDCWLNNKIGLPTSDIKRSTAHATRNSVVGLADDELTAEDIETLPETALEVWEYQYGQLAAESQRVLLAIKLLSLADAPFYKSLVEGVYRDVFDRPAPQHRLRNPVEPLLDQQWITLTDSDADPFEGETEYRVHDIQLEAIPDSVDNALEPFSNYLRTELQSDIPEAETEQRVFIHRRFANAVREMDTQESAQIATQQYQYILDSIDAEDPLTLLYYGNHLAEQGETEELLSNTTTALRVSRKILSAAVMTLWFIYFGEHEK